MHKQNALFSHHHSIFHIYSVFLCLQCVFITIQTAAQSESWELSLTLFLSQIPNQSLKYNLFYYFFSVFQMCIVSPPSCHYSSLVSSEILKLTFYLFFIFFILSILNRIYLSKKYRSVCITGWWMLWELSDECFHHLRWILNSPQIINDHKAPHGLVSAAFHSHP